MGGDNASSFISSSEEELLLEQDYPVLSLQFPTHLREDSTEHGESEVVFGEYDGVGRRIPSRLLDLEADQRRRRSVYKEVLENYDELRRRSENLEAAKNKILNYRPGECIEAVGGMKLSEYDVPQATSLLLIGPKGSGKSSLINRISRVFEDDKFAPDRAQVSYNSSVGDGTCFLQEYMIPRGSTSFCLYDTRSFSDDSSENIKMLKHWMTKGVRHGELVIRDSDSSSLDTRMKYKARQGGYHSRGIRKVNFVIFVVNGLRILKSMDGDDEADKQYTEMVTTTFNCPYLSFEDDKPVIVFTHGDLLSISERARVRVHLGELLGVPPTKQIFDIPESSDKATELAIFDMLRYSLEHADRNLPAKEWFLSKLWLYSKVFKVHLLACLFLLIAVILAARVQSMHAHGPPNRVVSPPNTQSAHTLHPPKHGTSLQNTHDHRPPKHEAPLPKSQKTHAHKPPKKHSPPPPKTHCHRPSKHSDPSSSSGIDWRTIRHLWL